MKFALLLLTTILLSGCASNCTHACIFGFGPGNSLFDSYAAHMDQMDGCQPKNKSPNWIKPAYCGSSNNKTFTIKQSGNQFFIEKK